MPPDPRPAPEFQASAWLHAPEPPTLGALRGRVVVALAFQMLCPGCVQYALPQLLRVRRAFHPDHVAVLALHTVFEHHAANSRATLEAFAHEYRLDVPIGIDAPDPAGGALPRTMAAYAMEGTPTLLLIDRAGRLRRQTLGHVEDLVLGAEIAMLTAERDGQAAMPAPPPLPQAARPARCVVPEAARGIAGGTTS
ncbi:peroxiredoxin family protein, partial [Falsiroseomonas oryzae]|uniref:peroxiredoxin family protein n=1 Tax=Falsiroseomonas oryzae TaxID=2766473 RepID=UPI0022EA5B56